MLKTGRDILGKIAGTASIEAELFGPFSVELVEALQSCFDCAKRCCSIATKKTKIWTSFHQVRQEKLPSVWKKFLSSINIVSEDPLLQQSVNQRLFDKFLQEYCQGFIESRSDTDQTTSEDAGTSSMSKDELNVLQYVGGYVPHSLLKKYEKRIQSGTKYEQFVTCLRNMAVLSEHDSFLEYTKEWIQRVNRGGLFPLNNTTYEFFISIEKLVRNILVPYLGKNRTSSNEQFKKLL